MADNALSPPVLSIANNEFLSAPPLRFWGPSARPPNDTAVPAALGSPAGLTFSGSATSGVEASRSISVATPEPGLIVKK